MSGSSYRGRIYETYASRFQDAAPGFDAQAAEAWGRPYDRYLRGWLPGDPAAAIIDLACGGGRTLHFFKRRGYTGLQGVDISPEQVRLALQVLPDVREGSVGEYLATRENTYDLAIGLDIVEHLKKDEVLPFLEACFGALKRGGRLVLQTPNADSPFVGSCRYGDLTHEVCFTPNALGRLLRLCGFKSVEAREAGPVVHGPASSIRWLTWQVLRAALCAYNLAETGTIGSGVYTRNFLITGRKT